ncbi:hypothetical protein BH11BAC6_BH11BAC6_14270 [soil metagenome]
MLQLCKTALVKSQVTKYISQLEQNFPERTTDFPKRMTNKPKCTMDKPKCTMDKLKRTMDRPKHMFIHRNQRNPFLQFLNKKAAIIVNTRSNPYKKLN